MVPAIKTMLDISARKGAHWNDEDCLSILCSFVEFLVESQAISEAQFRTYLHKTAEDDKAALSQA